MLVEVCSSANGFGPQRAGRLPKRGPKRGPFLEPCRYLKCVTFGSLFGHSLGVFGGHFLEPFFVTC